MMQGSKIKRFTGSLLAVFVFVAALGLSLAHAQEIIIWHDEQGRPHAAGSEQEIPPVHRPQAHGVMTTIEPEMVQMAISEGKALAAAPLLYRDGLGLFQPFQFELDLEKTTGYVFVGTKYNLVRAEAAGSAKKGVEVSGSYGATVNALDTLPIAFYSWRLKPVLMLLLQDGKIIKGEEGFDKDTNPGLEVPAYVKSFPYEAIDFSKPVQLQLYSREGNMVQLSIDLPAYR